MAGARLLVLGWLMQLKMQWRDPFTGIFAVLYPMFFATVAFLMFRVNGGAGALLYAAKIKVLEGNRIELESYGIGAIKLLGVRKL